MSDRTPVSNRGIERATQNRQRLLSSQTHRQETLTCFDIWLGEASNDYDTAPEQLS